MLPIKPTSARHARLIKAVLDRDPDVCGEWVMAARTRGYRYGEILKMACAIDPTLTDDEWDALLYESDSMLAICEGP